MPFFESQKFINSIFNEYWNEKELKDRMKHTAVVLQKFLPKEYESALEVINSIIDKLRNAKFSDSGFEFMFFPEFIERFGIEHFSASIKSIEFVTQFTSCEFAVRPFIVKYGDKMLSQMYAWTNHQSAHVRRLASEGCRPRLPWATALPALKMDPSPILPLLENLKKDASEYVRRSVANNINDISKDHPDVVLTLANTWKGIAKDTDAIIKHGSRTLLKQGHPEILEFYGLSGGMQPELSGFELITPKLKFNEDLKFSFRIKNIDKKERLLRMEYAIYFLRQNGQFSRKVFKISERTLQSNENISINRKQSFKPITTRKYYPGQHKVSLILNGKESEAKEFVLLS
jgi:3-methyladenine DNA glycosylase AlkC